MAAEDSIGRIQRLTLLMDGRRAAIALAIVFGVANAVSLFGLEPLNPTSITWLFGDTATYYSGWSQYRHDPHLHFPLAWTERAGYPIGASIAMFDAMPLVAILLRPLSPLLPDQFQWVGLYSALCFVLQTYFALRLCQRLFPSQPAFMTVGALFFLIAAPVTWRASGHTALMSHWLILAALYCYFLDPANAPSRWFARFWIVLTIALGTNPYIAAMCTVVTLAGLARLVLERRTSWRHAFVLLAGTVVVLAVSAAVIGVLQTREPSSYWAPGYGELSLNLNSLVNPMTYGSLVFPELPVIHPLQVEGYNYLGVGVIGLLLLNVVRQPSSIAWLKEPRVIPLVGVALMCAVVAISTTVSFGSAKLFEVPVPGVLTALLNAFRVSGRFFWPTHYLIILAALSMTFWIWNKPARLAILALALAVQMVDLATLRQSVYAANSQRYDKVLTSPVWTGLGKKYESVILVPPFQCEPLTGAGGPHSYVWFGRLAAAERMQLNSYYAARAMKHEMIGHCVDILRTQLAGTLDRKAVYVVTGAVQTVWGLAGVRSHRCAPVDVFILCTPVGASDPPGAPPPVPAAAAYALGHPLTFTATGDAAPYLTFGWGEPVDTGTWTQGPMAMVRLGVREPIDATRPLVLDVTALPYLIEHLHPRLLVDVAVNGQVLAEWIFPLGRAIPQRRVRVPAELVASRQGLDIEFRVRNPASPVYLGTGTTHAFVGLYVQSLAVRYEW